MVKYSFVLPAYKIKFFNEAIKSILTQTYKDFELIIVNDASPDDLASVVKSYDDARISYYENEKNIGGKNLVAQWNHCLKYANGEYIILASDDDIYSPLYLEKMNELVCKYPNINVFRPRVQFIDSVGKLLRIEGHSAELTYLPEFIYRWMTDSISSGIPFYIFKRQALESINGFINYPLAWGSDDITVMSLASDGIVVADDILFSFRLSDINISTKKNNFSTFIGKLSAMTFMFADLKDLVNKLKPVGDLECYYIEKIQCILYTYMQGKTFALLINTDLLVVLKNLKRILSCEWISRKWFIRAFIPFVYKKIRY